MILLRPDCLVFEIATGERIACSAEAVAIEVIGDPVLLDPEIVKNAAAAVLHYFKHDLDQAVVSVAEFAAALKRALEGLGLRVSVPEPGPIRIANSDLERLACEVGPSMELIFYARLREELRRHLREMPQVLRFRGLHACVKQLLGAKRWSPRCQVLNDQIVTFLRQGLGADGAAARCALVVM
jgi:hypothetical protein